MHNVFMIQHDTNCRDFGEPTLTGRIFDIPQTIVWPGSEIRSVVKGVIVEISTKVDTIYGNFVPQMNADTLFYHSHGMFFLHLCCHQLHSSCTERQVNIKDQPLYLVPC